MSATPRRTWSRARVTQVRQRIDARGSRAPVPEPERDWRFHDAASVLAWYEVNPTLQPVGRDGEADMTALERLAIDSICYEDDGNRRRWTLKNDVRKRVLARLGTRERIMQALQTNRVRPHNVLQRTFEAYLTGTPTPLDLQTLDELSATLQVLDWLPDQYRAEANDLPCEDDVRRRIELASLRAPFVSLAGEHFRGRTRELGLLRDYVGVLEPSSTAARLRRGLRRILSLKEKPPLVIFGPGGMGKSSLLAKFILEHTGGAAPQLPFIYLDCDRPGLIAAEPLTLLLEAVRQLAVQYPDHRDAANRWLAEWQRELTTAAESPDGTDASTRATRRNRASYISELGAFIEDLDLGEAPLLLVLDTFEEVQYRGNAYIEELWRFLDELQGVLPRLRTVIAGRAKLKKFVVEELELGSLDLEAALGFLEAHGVTDPALARIVARQMRGNPLSLKLAAQILRVEAAGSEGVKDLDTGGLLSRVDDNRIQGQLYRRILSHISSSDVRKLAHPGLILRKITPDLIQCVLAEPCGVDVSTPGRAQELFDELAREVSLVTITRGAENEARHRADVRRVILDLIRKADAMRVRDIQLRAVSYYATRSATDVQARAEEIYHRLGLDEDPASVAALWVPGVDEYLRSAVEDLQGRAQTFLARQMGMELDDAAYDEEPLEIWEQGARKRAEDLLSLGRPGEALEGLQRRSARTIASPLLLLEARALEQLGRMREARQMAARAIGELRVEDANRLEAHLIAARADEVLRDRPSISGVAAEYAACVQQGPASTRLVALGLCRFRLLGKWVDEGAAEAADELAGVRRNLTLVVTRLDEATIHESPDLFREIVRQRALDDPALLARTAELVSETPPGRGDPSPTRKQAAEAGHRVSSHLDAAQRARLRAALIDAMTTRTDLTLVAKQWLDLDVSAITGPKQALLETIDAVLEWTIAHDRVGELLAGARSMRPDAELLAAIAEELQTVDYQAQIAEQTVLVGGAHPFVARPILRQFLSTLEDPKAPPILIVQGPSGSGKTYSLRLAEFVSRVGGGFDLVSVAVDQVPRPHEFVAEIARALGANAETVPSGKPTAQHIRELLDWMLAVASQRKKPVLLAVDNLNGPLRQDMRDFVGELIPRVARSSVGAIRLLLLGWEQSVDSALQGAFILETLTPFQRADLVTFFNALLESRPVGRDSVEQLADQVDKQVQLDAFPGLRTLNKVLGTVARDVLRGRGIPFSTAREHTGMEFLLVQFDDVRKVIIDDVHGDWLTRETLNIEAGWHRVTLAPPADFEPQEIATVLHHTDVLNPKRITFTRRPADPGRPL